MVCQSSWALKLWREFFVRLQARDVRLKARSEHRRCCAAVTSWGLAAFSLIGSHGHTFPQDIFLKRRHNLVTFVQVRPFLIISYFDTAISVGLGLRRKHRRNIRTGGSAVERCWEVFAGMVGCTWINGKLFHSLSSVAAPHSRTLQFCLLTRAIFGLCVTIRLIERARGTVAFRTQLSMVCWWTVCRLRMAKGLAMRAV